MNNESDTTKLITTDQNNMTDVEKSHNVQTETTMNIDTTNTDVQVSNQEISTDPIQENEATNEATTTETATETTEPAKKIEDFIKVEMRDSIMEMGFSKAVSEKAVFLTQSASVEAAMAWIEEHQEDADFEEELIITNIKEKEKLTKEQIEARAKELSKAQHEKFLEKEKLNDLEQEKFRRNYQKELIAAKKLADEAEEKRLRDIRNAEKTKYENEKKAMQEQLRRDKELKFGKKFDTAEVAKEKTQPPEHWFKEGLKTLSRLYPVSRDGDKLPTTLNTLTNIMKNLEKDPSNEKFRTLKLDNAKVKERIVDMAGATLFLKGAGFLVDNTKNILYAEEDKITKEIASLGIMLINEKKELITMGN